MKIKKIKGTYNDYQVELSFGQLQSIKNALGADHADPVSDELYAELNWYLDNIPGPGEDEEDLKKAEEVEDSGLAAPDAEGQPLKPSADDLLPMPGEGGEGPGGPEGEDEVGGDFGPPPEEGGELSPEGGEEPEPESEADRRLPAPPAD